MGTQASRRFARAFKTLFARTGPARAAVACSGGLDSIALLDLLRRQLGNGVVAIHLDHAQRSEAEAQADRTVVERYCRAHGLELRFQRLRLPRGASEAAMREARYEALAELAGERTIVFTAHHADDELETLLFRLIRGAHPETIRGIAPRARRKLANGRTLRLARPLLGFAKSELLEHARQSALAWREDASNRSARYARNRIRIELLPLLEDLRPGAARRLRRFFAQLTKENHRPQTNARRVAAIANGLRSTHGFMVRHADFLALQSAIHKMMGEDCSRTTQAHWESLKHQLDLRLKTREGSGPTKLVQFPGGHAVRFVQNRLYWIKTTRKTP